MEGMNKVKTTQQVYNKPLFTMKAEDDVKRSFISPEKVEENRVVQKTGDMPEYFERIRAIKTRLDEDKDSSDSTGTYRALHDMVNFFVDNYKYFDEIMEIRMLTILHAKALDYYNTHRGTRFSPKGRYRKNIANDLRATILTTINEELPMHMRYDALVQLSSVYTPPKIFANEPDYVTDVTANSEVLGEYLIDAAKQEYIEEKISYLSVNVEENGEVVRRLPAEVTREMIEKDANNIAQINKYTANMVFRRKREFLMLDYAQASLPEGQELEELVAHSIYGTDSRRIVKDICKRFNMGRDGQPVSEADVKIRDENRRLINLLFSEDPADHVEVLNAVLPEYMNLKVDDISHYFDEEHPVSDLEVAKYVERTFDQYYWVIGINTIFENLLRTIRKSGTQKEDVPEYKKYRETYDEATLKKIDDRGLYLSEHGVLYGYMLTRLGMNSIMISKIVEHDDAEQIRDLAPERMEYLKNFDLNVINEPINLEKHKTEYLNNYNLMLQNSGFKDLITANVDAEKANKFNTRILEREAERDRAISHDPDFVLKMEFLNDKNLEEAFKHLAKIKPYVFEGEDFEFEEIHELEKPGTVQPVVEQRDEKNYYKGYNLLLESFINKNQGQIGKNVTQLFNDFLTISTKPEAFFNTDDIDNLIRLSDYAKAIPCLLKNRLVLRWVDEDLKNTLLAKSKRISAMCDITFAHYQKAVAIRHHNTVGEDKYQDDLVAALKACVESIDSDVDVDDDNISKIELSEIEFAQRGVELCKNEEEMTAKLEANDKKLKEADEFGKLQVPYIMDEDYYGETPVSLKIKQLFNSENAAVELIKYKRIIDAEFAKFSNGKCLMQGKYPLPALAECHRIKSSGSLSAKFALMISLQSVVDQGVMVNSYGDAVGQNGMFRERELRYAPRIMAELTKMLDELCNDLLFKDYDTTEEVDNYYSEYAMFHVTFDYFARREIFEAVEDNLAKIGKTVSNATREERLTAYLAAAATGADLGANIMRSERMSDKRSGFYINSVGDQTRHDVEVSPICQHYTDINSRIHVKDTQDAATKLFDKNYSGMKRKDADAKFHEIFDDTIKNTIQSYVDTGLATDEYCIRLRDRFIDLSKFVDLKDEKHNAKATSFKSLVLDPLAALILAYPVDINGQHSEKYNTLHVDMVKSLNEYVRTHDPRSKEGNQRLTAALELLVLLTDEDYFNIQNID